jgi:hypothetical protein
LPRAAHPRWAGMLPAAPAGNGEKLASVKFEVKDDSQK